MGAVKPKLSYSVAEAAEATSLSKVYLRREIKAGRLAAARIGKRILIFPDALAAMLEQGRRELISGSK